MMPARPQSSALAAIAAPRVFDGESWHEQAAVVHRGGHVEAILPAAAVPPGTVVESIEGMLVPGFVDLQVNGGGGLMLNDRPSAETIAAICGAHAAFGTTALLATLITDTQETTAAAVAAGAEAARLRVPGFLGLHLEGPHLAVARKGAHDPALIRPMGDDDQAFLTAARRRLPLLVVTVAPESVEPRRITALVEAGIVVSLGHSDASFAAARACADAGASMITHLFNAMSQLGNREPGVVGAALETGALSAGLIADGFHVDPATMAVALRAKRGPGRIFLVTDAMATIGTDLSSFQLNGRTVHRTQGRLTLEDGTLAGADLDMISAVRLVHRQMGVDLSEALRMASLYPARSVGRADRIGRLGPGTAADAVALSPELQVRKVWSGGSVRYEAARP